VSTKFSHEDLEVLRSLAESETAKPILARMWALVECLEERVTAYDLSSGSDRDFIFIKAEAQGAKKLYKAFEQDLLALRKPSKS
jgi:hypothetical protein